MIRLLTLALAILLPALGFTEKESTVVPEGYRISDYEAELTLARALSYQKGRKQKIEALKRFELLLTEQPDNPELLLEASHLYLSLKKYKEALAALYIALEKIPNSIDLLLPAAQAEAALGHYFKAKTLMERILSPCNSSRITRKEFLASADLMVAWGDFYKAAHIYRQALEKKNGSLKLALTLASILASSQQYEEAEMIYNNLLKERPLHPKVLEAIILLKVLQKDFATALEYAQCLVESYPERPQFELLKADVLYLNESYEEALSLYQTAKLHDKYRVKATLKIGKTYLKMLNFGAAETAFREVLKLEPNNIEALFYLEPLEDRKRIPCIISETNRPEDLYLWANLYVENGLAAYSEPFLREALEKDPEYFPAKVALAETLSNIYDYCSSLEIYEELLDSFEDNSKILLAIARVLGWSERYDSSLEWYDYLIELNPHDPVPLRERARTAIWGQMYDESMCSYRRLASFEGRGELDTYLIRKGASLEMQAKQLMWDKRYRHALPVFEEIMDFQPGNEEMLYDYAQDYCIIGRCDYSRALYYSLLHFDPNHNLVNMALDRNLLRQHIGGNAVLSYWRELGSGSFSQSQIARYQNDYMFEFPLTCLARLRFIQHFWVENPFYNYQFYPAEGQSLEADYTLDEYVKLFFSITYKNYLRKFKNRFTSQNRAYVNLNDYCLASFGVDLQNEIYNYFSLKQGTQAICSWVSLYSDFNRYWNVEALYQHFDYNDSNAQHHVSLKSEFAYTDDPHVVKLILIGGWRNTRHATISILDGTELVDVIYPYWTPQKYYYGNVILQLRQDYRFFKYCEGPERYVDLKIAGGDDTSDNPSIEIVLEWKHDFFDGLGFQLKGLIHRSPQWNAEGAWGVLTYRF